jgi:hypothetical protein
MVVGGGGENGIGLLVTVWLDGLAEGVAESVDGLTGALEPAWDFCTQPASSSTTVPATASLVSTIRLPR